MILPETPEQSIEQSHTTNPRFPMSHFLALTGSSTKFSKSGFLLRSIGSILAQRAVEFHAVHASDLPPNEPATRRLAIQFVQDAGELIEHASAIVIVTPATKESLPTLLTSLLEAKRLDLVRELLPGTGLIAVLIDPQFAQAEAQLRELEEAARTLSLRLDVLKASDEAELDAALATVATHGANALLVASDPFFDTQRARIIASARQHKVPAIYQFREYPVAGGLMSYGISLADAYRQFGAYTGRILKGAKPADLPVQQSSKFELVINLKTAKALGLAIPSTLLARADEVIE